MKKKKIILLPLFALILASCGSDPSSSAPSSSEPISEEPPIVIPSEDSIIIPPSSSVPSVTDLTPIEDVKELDLDIQVTTGGLITSIYGDAVGSSVTIQDGEDAFLLYGVSEDVLGDFEVGDSIEVTGTTAAYNGLPQLAKATVIKDAADTYSASVLDVTGLWATMDMLEHGARLVKFTDVSVSTADDADLDPGNAQRANAVQFTIHPDAGPEAGVLVHSNWAIGFSELSGIATKINGMAKSRDTVDVTGTVSAYQGTAQLFLTANSDLVVNEKVVTGPAVTGVTLDVETLDLDIAETHQLVATIAPADAGNKEVSFKSSDSTVATVVSNGTITAVGAGSATITVTTADGGFEDSVAVTVSTTIAAITPEEAHALAIGDPVTVRGTITATVREERGQHTIQVGDVGISTFDYTLRQLTVGNDYVLSGVIADYNGLKQISNVKVIADLGPATTPITPRVITSFDQLTADISGTLVSIEGLEYVSGTYLTGSSGTNVIVSLGGEEMTLRAEGNSSGDVAAANAFFADLSSVDRFNLVTPLGWHNNAQLSLADTTKLVKVEVEAADPTGVTLDVPTLDLDIGATHSLVATVEPSDAAQDVTYVSSDTAVATVDENGLVSAKSAGTATITATVVADPTLSATVAVTVSENVIDSITPADAHALEKGATATVHGKVAAQISNDAFIIQVGDRGISTYKVDGLVVGNDVLITGTIDEYNGLKQIASATVIDLGASGTTVTPKVITSVDQLTADLTGTLVSLEGLKYVSGVITVDKNSTIKFSLNGTEVSLYVNYHTAGDVEAANTFFATLEGNDTLNITTPLGWYKGAQLALADATVFERNEVPYDAATAVTVTAAGDATSLPSNRTLQLSAAVAPVTANPSVTWTSSDDAIATVNASGLVSGVATGEVTITATSLTAGVLGTIVLTITEAADETFATDLFISEYIEGTGSNKVLEIFNGTGEAVDLSNYTVALYSNGSTTAKTVQLSGTLEHGEVYIMAHNKADPAILAIADLTDAGVVFNWNGDDAVALIKGDTTIDFLGVLGERPNWGKDVTIVRKASISSPNDEYTETEWDVHATDDLTFVGAHVFTPVA